MAFECTYCSTQTAVTYLTFITDALSRCIVRSKTQRSMMPRTSSLDWLFCNPPVQWDIVGHSKVLKDVALKTAN